MEYLIPLSKTTWNREYPSTYYTTSTKEAFLPIERTLKSKLQLTIQEIELLFEKDKLLGDIYIVVESYIDEENFTIPQLASQLYTTRTTLYREVKKKTGRSIITLVKLIRLLKANRLLKSTDLPISSIAYQVGFKAPSHFTTSYKKEYGYSPKVSRNS